MHPSLFMPFYCSIKNRFLPKGEKPWKAIGLAFFCLIVCLALYLVSYKVVSYFHAQNELGIFLSIKIFEMAWITMFAMLVFSCMVSGVSGLFLSKDNEIVFSAPVSPARMYCMRFWTMLFNTSWMMLLFSLPVYIAFGQVFAGGFTYYVLLIFSLFAVTLIAVGVGLLIIVVLVNLFPAKRTKDIIFYLSLCFAIFIYLLFRMIRPELLANPDQFSTFIEYLSSISTPAGPYIPAAWAANFLSLYLMDHQIDWLLGSLLATCPVAVFIVGEWLMQFLFFSGYSKSQESFGGYRSFKASRIVKLTPFRMFISKETKAFVRDSAEWSQLFMIAALVVVYLYNFKMLPLDLSFWKKEYLANLISFLNIGLTGFVIISLSARFVFPSVGAEGGSFYLIKSAPISLSRFLFYKYVFYAGPLLFLSLILITVSDYLLNIQGPVFWISVFTSSLITMSVLGLALAFGAIYPDFNAENRAAAVGSIGALVYLLVALVYTGVIVGTGAVPAYWLTKKYLIVSKLTAHDFIYIGGWAILAVVGSIVMVGVFLRRAIRCLEG